MYRNVEGLKQHRPETVYRDCFIHELPRRGLLGNSEGKKGPERRSFDPELFSAFRSLPFSVRNYL